MENYEWKKASDKLEKSIREFELIILEIKVSHGKMKMEMLKNTYSFEKKENEYIKRINELEKKLNDINFEYPPILGYPLIIDVEVE
ncbi:hypothetical protein [Aliarcobacter butzleri]|uniref:hypothetical protein n=1 Tax=Aliarcobacter butzleri TaxID=28197 RepID=UPI0021B4A461|nr:hypothetical protein [Aliarcobacter butzleri]MCG3717674.1 hypothetical protein [Aliarcobacter butzleri]MCT7614048.1 hypothetical protein [Aliarcobacter butzleri]